MNFSGVFIGLGAFAIIGMMHPIVIKSEYYFGKKCWPLYAGAGILSLLISLLCENLLICVLLGVLGFSLFWSIHELFEQEERVKKGWYPENPAKRRSTQNIHKEKSDSTHL